MKRENNYQDYDSLFWKSSLDERFSVFTIYPEHTLYKKFESTYFKYLGVAFLEYSTMTIFIDGKEISKDGYTSGHIFAIEAHEIAHYILKHNMSDYNKDYEKSADIAAIKILEKFGHTESATLLINRFNSLYNEPNNIDDVLTKNEKKYLNEYLNKVNVKKYTIFHKLVTLIKKIFT